MRRICVVLAVFCIAGMHWSAYAHSECYDHLPVTGYYTPLRADFDAQTSQEILVDAVPRTYNASFLAHAKIKGKGITVSGEMLLYEDEEWSADDYPVTDEEKKWFPYERDFVTTRTITTLEDGKTRVYPKAFVDACGEEGWCQIVRGEYIGKPWDCSPTDGRENYLSPQCDSKWHYATKPLDANNRRLELGVVATNKKYFDPGNPWKVTIDPRPSGFLSNVFEARDTGVELGVDVFVGSGLKGLARTMEVTNRTSKVCFIKSTSN